MPNYRDNWFKVGAVLAMVVAGIMALSHRRISRLRVFSALNFAALLVHQFEEYGVPGYFPGHFNAGILKSEKPDRYPLNTNSALIINTALAYPFYLLPILFPKRRWLGLSTRHLRVRPSGGPRYRLPQACESPLQPRVSGFHLLARAHRRQLSPRSRLRAPKRARRLG